jgi:hypothetical protein
MSKVICISLNNPTEHQMYLFKSERQRPFNYLLSEVSDYTSCAHVPECAMKQFSKFWMQGWFYTCTRLAMHRSLTGFKVTLGGLVVACLPLDTRFAGSNPAENYWLLRATKISSIISFGGEIKPPSVPYRNILRHIKEQYDYESDTL